MIQRDDVMGANWIVSRERERNETWPGVDVTRLKTTKKFALKYFSSRQWQVWCEAVHQVKVTKRDEVEGDHATCLTSCGRIKMVCFHAKWETNAMDSDNGGRDDDDEFLTLRTLRWWRTQGTVDGITTNSHIVDIDVYRGDRKSLRFVKFLLRGSWRILIMKFWLHNESVSVFVAKVTSAVNFITPRKLCTYARDFFFKFFVFLIGNYCTYLK